MALRFWLNDRLIEEADVAPTTTLLEYLRRDLRMTGTKEGCAEGDCGACTVAVLDPDGPAGPQWRAINGCLLLLPMLHGRHVVTVEGLQRDGALHPAQSALVERLGSQCGYCTPGIVMSLFEATYRADVDAPWKVDDQLCGNLCRCTGYRPIREAGEAVAGLRPADPFAARLANEKATDRSLTYAAHGQQFHQPATLDALWDVLDTHPDARFVTGATDLGLDVTKKHVAFPCLVSLGAIPDLQRVDERDDGWAIGGAVRLTDLEALSAAGLPALARMLRYFGSRQIKHGATVAGNLCNASPIGDLAPVLLALGASVIAASREGERAIPIDAFFVGYRQTALRPGEILARITVPRPPPDARIAAYKVSKRRELDISAVAGAFYVRVGDDGRVTEARLGYGGMAATPARARHTEAALIGQTWSAAQVGDAALAIDQDFKPLSDHRGSAWYRATVAKNLLIGFFEETRDVRVPMLPLDHAGTVIPGGA